MIYHYQNKNKIIEISAPMGKAPETVTKDNVVYERIYFAPYVAIDTKTPKTVGDIGKKNSKEYYETTGKKREALEKKKIIDGKQIPAMLGMQRKTS